MITGLFTRFRNTVLTLLTVAATIAGSYSAEASHTRGSTIYWEKHPSLNNTIILYMSTSVAGSRTVGTFNTIGDGGTLNFNASVNVTYSVNGTSNVTSNSVSTLNGQNMARVVYNNTIENYHSEEIGRVENGVWVPGVIVTYNQTSWPYALTFENVCCRVSNISAGTGTESNLATTVNLTAGNSSASSSSPAVIQVPASAIGGTWTYQLTATDPDQDNIVFRLGTKAEFGGSWAAALVGAGPAGLSISSTGLITWNIPAGTSASALAVLGYVIEDRDPFTNNLKSRSSYDIILRLVNTSTNQAPVVVSQPNTTQFFPYQQNLNTPYNFKIVVEDVYNSVTNQSPNPSSASPAGYVNWPYPQINQIGSVQNFTYSLTNLPNQRVEINGTFTPTLSQAGATYNVSFEVNDGSLITYPSVFIQVRNNPSPSITDFQKVGSLCTGIPFTASDFTANYSDPDQDGLEWIRLTNIPNTGQLLFKGVQVASGDELLLADISQLSYVNATPGIYTVTWEAKDDQGYWSTSAEVISLLIEGVKTSGLTNTSTTTTSPVAIDPQLIVEYNGTQTAASVAIMTGYDPSDVLQVNVPSGITANATYSAGVLSISGSFTSAELQSVLRAVTFQSATNSVTRSFTFQVGAPTSPCDAYASVRTLNNSAPTITGAVDQATCLTGTTTAQTLTISDTETPVANLVVSVVSSSNTTVVPLSNVSVTGTGSTRTVTVANSGVYGSSVITLAVTDAGGGSSTISFVWTNTVSDGIENSAGTTFNPYAGTPIVIDPYVAVTTGSTLNGAVVSIDNFKSGDVLGLATGYTLPSGISTNYNSGTGVLTISGSASAATMQAVLRKVVFSTTSTDETSRTVSYSLGTAVPNAATGHYYEYVPSANITWAQAKAAAAQRSFNGLGGYLATITSSAENQFVLTKLTNDGWLGGSDDFSEINTALGSMIYANQTSAEGNWHWVTGPTSDRVQFWAGGVNGSAPNGVFANWNYPNQPDNHLSAEHYLQIYFQQAGKWNDLPGSHVLQGYIVEYGGLSTDNAVCFAISDTKVIDLNQTPTITLPTAAPNCIGTTSIVKSITVADANDGTGALQLTLISSSNTSLVPLANVTFGGSGANRTVTVTPTSSQTGTANLVIQITDRYGKSSQQTLPITVSANSALSIQNSLCGSQSLLWATWNNVTSTSGQGTFGNLGVTVSVTHSAGGLSTTSSMFNHAIFPSTYTVPNTTSLRNDLAGTFTFCFSQPVDNPQVAFSSIGNPSTPVGITTSVPYQVIWSGQAVAYNSPTSFTGNEGFTIVSFPGTHQCITLVYAQNETYANLAFGFENYNCTAPQICPGDAITLTASGGSAYQWSPSTGLSGTNTAIVTASPTATTTYTVVDPSNPCASPQTITVNVSQTPSAPTAIDQNICPDATFSELVASVPSGQSVRWYTTATGGTALANTSTVTPGTYFAEAVDLTCGVSLSRTSVVVSYFPDLIETSSGSPMLVKGTPEVVDPQLIVNETNAVDGALVLISSGFVSGDVLDFPGTLPTGVTKSYNASTGVLTISGTIQPADLQNVLRGVTINTTSTNGQNRTVSFNLGSALPSSSNNHYYQFITSSGISWTAAKAAAEQLTLYGMQGYLATITSAAENQFVVSKLNGQGWMGASDATTENVWKWETGPEAGQQFWQGLSTGSAVSGRYNNWASGEPNNAGNEDYAHFLTNGQWNDYPLQLGNINGYVVEFGGMPNDPCVVLVADRVVNVTISTPPTVTTSSPIGATTGSTALISGQVVSDGGAAITERGFVIGLATAPTTTPAAGGFKITDAAATTGQFTGTFTGLQPNTVYYTRAYAINAMGTAYGSEVVFTTPPALPATVTTNQNDPVFGGTIICSGTSTTLTSSTSVGVLEWFSGSCGGTAVGTGNSVTVSPTTTTTYYVRVYNASTGLRSTCESVTVTVQAAAPTISYASPYYLYYSSEAITPNSISVSGSGAQAYIASYAISPALPAGLSFNTATGQITGTATNGSPRATYTVTGTTPCGTTSTTLEIEVLECSGLNISDFLLRGNATTLGSGSATEFRLTDALGAQFGAVWNQTRLDLTRDFDISSQIYLGNNNAGADGIAFVLQPLSTNQGSSGGGLGYAGINPSVAVEFDTYQNSADISNDHAAFMINGNTADHSNGLYDLGNIEDGLYRTARFKWEAATKTFRVFVGGTQILSKTNWDIVGTILNNNPYVYWGFTGATGGAVNVQKVKFDRYCLTLAANTVAQVTTDTPIGTVTSTSAAISGEVVNDGGSPVTERGFVVGLASAPTTTPAAGGFKITDAAATVGTFAGTFAGLQPATQYFARAYAINGMGTEYGNEISFFTRPADITGITSSDYNTTHQANVICYGASTTLTAAGVSGTVYWYTGSCGGTQVGTGNTLTVSPTTTTTYYARNYNNNLFSDGCASITVVVRPQLVAPTISGAEIICWNSQATGLTGTQATGGSSAAASAGFSYQWQKSEDFGATWQNLVGETNYASMMPGYLYQTTQYRLLATDLGSPACTTNIASNVIEVTVRDPFTPSVVSTTNPNNTVCQAGSVSLTATPTTGGSGPPFLYQWQSSLDSVNWVNVGPALQNTTAYTVPSVTTDTYYRLIAFDMGTPGCGSVFSTNAVLATVQTAITEGAISGAQHICAGTAPTAPIASVTVGTGRGTISYRWEASTDNGQTWTTISGATGASYQPGILQTTTDYRRFTVSTVNNVDCESLQPTSVVRITVDQLPVATIATAGTTSCVNTAVTVPGVTINHGTAVWTHNGQGAITGTLSAPVYTPVAADAGTTVTLTLTVTGTAICLNVPAVDTYVIVVDPLPVATAGGSATICENATHTVVGAASANGTILWTHNGVGTLTGATTLTPTYTAAAGDAGQAVTLTMTVSSNNTCTPATATATYTVNVDQLPAASAGGTQTICSLASATVSGASAARGSILWTHNGSGTISGATTLTPTYTAGAADAGTTVTLTMTVTSTNVCGPQTAVATYTVVVRPDFVPATFVNQMQDLCYNTGASQITATAATGGTGPYAYQWQVSTDSTSWTNIAGATSLTYTPSGTFTSSRYYRILSTDLGTPTCGTTLAGAADVKLLVRAPLTPPVLANVTICQGTSTTLTPSLALGGRNNFTYQWQQSANGTTGWTNVGTSSTSIAFTTPNLTGTTFYRVIARDENVTLNNLTYISCGSTFSQPIRVTVAATTTAGAISGDETTCVGAATAAIASATAGTASGTISYRWEQSTDNGTTWTAVQGATAATYAPGALTQTTMFRRITISLQSGTTCESTPTSPVTKTVQQLAVFTAAGSNVTTNTDAGLPTAVVNYTVTATAVTPVTLTYAFTGATTATGNGTGSGSAFGIGTTTVTVTATTQCGASTSTFTVEVIDNENPVITAGSDLNVSTTTATTGCAMPVTVTSPVATDNAPGVQVSYVLTGATTGSGTSISGVSFNVGTTVITWTATDGSGNTATDVQNVVVTDAVLPAIAGTPANITVNATAGLCTAPATWTVPTASDECGIQTFTGSAASGDLFPVGVTTVTYTATDIHGNVATSSFTVTVVDNQLPVISGTPANITVTSDANACGTTVTWTAATAADNCAISTFTPNIASGSFFAVGRTRVRYTAVDINGNSDTSGFWVQVLDLNPILSNMPANISVSNAAGLCSAVVTWNAPSFTDNCSGTVLTSTHTPGQAFAVGTTTVTYTATDNNGNVTSASFTVTVNDTELPVWSNVPANITVAARATSCDAVVTWPPLTVADNCTAQPTVTSTKASGDVFALGTTTVTFTGVDAAGNSASTSFTVTVVDQTAPVITVPANITASVDANSCVASTVVVSVPSATDQCDPVTAAGVRSDNLALSAPYPTGVTTITWTASDLAGNAATPVLQTVTVIDTIAPYVAMSLDSVVYVDENSCVYYWENWRADVITVDNCGEVPVLTSARPQNLFLNKGVHIINFTLSDSHGNARVYNHRVRVADTISPKLMNMPTNITAYAGANCQTIVSWVDPTPSDNCVNFVMTSSHYSGDVFPIGTTAVTFLVTDAAGQTVSGGFTVTVLDTAKPVIQAQTATLALNANGQATLTLAQVLGPNGITDNCGIASSTLSKTAFTCADLGSNTVAITATDVNGNVRTVNVSVNVVDQIQPALVNVPASMTLYASPTLCGAVASWPAITATDNCSAVAVSTSVPSGTTFSTGTTVVMVNAVDGSGNQVNASFNVVVLDTIAPIWTNVPSNSVTGACASGVVFTVPSATDNCGSVTVVQTSGLPSGSIFPVGVTTNTFVATDASGNTSTVSFTVTVQGSTFTYTPAQTVFCQNDPSIDLMPFGGVANLTFSGAGVDGSIFNPYTAGVGNHVITYTYVDSLGCQTVQTFTVTVSSSPSKPVIMRMTSTTLKVVDTYLTYQWRRNGVNIPGATQQTFNVTLSGIYDVVVTNGLCSNISDPYGFGVTIGEDELDLNDLRVQPNPNNGQFTLIHSLPLDEVQSVQIVDMLGRVIYEAPLSDARMTFDVRTIAQGQYLVVVRSATNVITKPIVIQH